MAAFFSDSSALAKVYVVETGSAWMRALLPPATANEMFVSRISSVEVAAALARRVRAGSLSATDAQQGVTTLRADFGATYRIIEVTIPMVEHALQLTQTYALRAYDAMQLAAALLLAGERSAAGMNLPIFLCSDAQLTSAAASEGLAVDDPNLHP